MRKSCVIFLLLACATLAVAEDKNQSDKSPVTADTIIQLVGTRMANVFVKLGPPDTVGVGDPGQVWLHYDKAGFSLLIEQGDKTVACVFWPDWKQTVMGVKLSDSQDEMIQKLGKPEITKKNANGQVELDWNIKDQKIDLVARFRDDKCTRIFMPKWGGTDAVK